MRKRSWISMFLAGVMIFTMIPAMTVYAACSHPSSIGTKVSTSYSQIDGDDVYHLKTDYYVMYCTSCGEVTDMSEERESEVKHSFNSYGKCTVCKYQKDKDCDHNNTSRRQLGNTSYNQISGDNVYHEVEKHYQVDCNGCGEIVDYDYIIYDDEKHSFNSYGKCTVCKYQKDIICSHNSTSKIQLGSTTYNLIDDTYHGVEKHYRIDCNGCGKITNADSKETSTAKHTFNSKNVCTACGYEKVCAHNNTSKIQ